MPETLAVVREGSNVGVGGFNSEGRAGIIVPRIRNIGNGDAYDYLAKVECEGLDFKVDKRGFVEKGEQRGFFFVKVAGEMPERARGKITLSYMDVFRKQYETVVEWELSHNDYSSVILYVGKEVAK